MPIVVKCARCGAVLKRLVELGGETLAEHVGGMRCPSCKCEIKGRLAGELIITAARSLAMRRGMKWVDIQS